MAKLKLNISGKLKIPKKTFVKYVPDKTDSDPIRKRKIVDEKKEQI